MRDQLRAELSIAAQTMAIQGQKPPPGLIHDSDCGTQYAAAKYRNLITAANPEKEIARIGSCFGTLKTELVYETRFPRGTQRNESCLPLSKDTIIVSGCTLPSAPSCQSKPGAKPFKSGVH